MSYPEAIVSKHPCLNEQPALRVGQHEQGWHKACGCERGESTAGPIQRVQHPGPTSKDPEEGKLASCPIILAEKKIRTDQEV